MPALRSAVCDWFREDGWQVRFTSQASSPEAAPSPMPSRSLRITVELSSNELARLYADLVLRRAFALMRRILERGVARGEFRPLDTEATVPLVVAPVVLLGVWKHSFGAHTDLVLDRRRVLEAHCENLIRGLAADPGGRS